MKSRKWIYLLAGLGVLYKEKVTYPNREEIILKNIDVRLRRISLTEKDRIRKPHEELGYRDRFIFYISDGIKNDNFAQTFADAVMSSLALVSGVTVEDIPIAVGIPEDVIKKDRFIRIKDLIGRDCIGSEMYFKVMNSTDVPSEVLDYAWHVVPAIVENESLMNGAHFYKESIGQVWVADDDVFEFMHDNSPIPTSHAEKARVETAYQNAFKAIEAIIGEPPKDVRKLRRKLIQAGINPDEKVGYELFGMKPGKETVIKKVLDMQEIRDKMAAHGKTSTPRTIDYCEVKDKQSLASYLLLTHIHSILGCTN